MPDHRGEHPLRAVVLAAGVGSRLGAHTSAMPKPLISIRGKPLIAYTLDALTAAALPSALVVTGYREEQLRAALAGSPIPLEFVSNRRYQREASYSLRAAREYCADRPFLLLMSDHLFSPGLVASLISHFTEAQAAAREPGRPAAERSLVAADFADFYPPAYVDEATRLAVDRDGLVTGIGKDLDRWDALDCGAFICTPDVWDALDAVGDDCSLSVIFGELARNGRLGAADVTGHFWYDVDTEADRVAAEMLLAAEQALHG